VIKQMSYGQVVLAYGQRQSKHVAVSYEYDESDPLIVNVTFHEAEEFTGTIHHIQWQIGRDLFIQAMKEGWSGEADVKLIQRPKCVVMKLETDEFTSVIELNRSHLEDFIEQTKTLIPIGREPMDATIDAVIEALLEDTDE
jgi:hypothetical protein